MFSRLSRSEEKPSPVRTKLEATTEIGWHGLTREEIAELRAAQAKARKEREADKK